MSARERSIDGLELGGNPRVHLLPPEIEGLRKVRATRRTLLGALAAAVLIVIVAVGGVSILLASAIQAQASEQQSGVRLAAELKKYSSVTGVQAQVDAILAGQPVGVAGEILWSPFIASVQATVPEGAAITNFIARLDVPDGTVANPLTSDHVATVSVTAQGPQDVLTGWLAKLTTIKGVVGATPGDFAVDESSGTYVVNVDLLVNSDVVADRFKTGS